MSSTNCLNCGHSLSNKFCAQCGQKADTHRITVKHFIEHDLLHGVFHIDKGILFTIKETFTRPGHAAMDYIKGKRVSYYNIFYLLVIIIGLNLLILHYLKENADAGHHGEVVAFEGDWKKLGQFFKDNIKAFILSFIPLFALNAYLVFWRVKLNIAEQHIIAGFVLLGCALMALCINLLGMLPFSWQTGFVGIISEIIGYVLLLFPLFVYYTAFGAYYKKLGFLWRIIMMYFIFFIQILIILLTVVYFLTGGAVEGSLLLK